MAQYVAEVTVVIEMNDGGGLSRPDDFAGVAQTLVNVTAHPWVRNSTVGKIYIRSGDIPQQVSGGVSPSEG